MSETALASLGGLAAWVVMVAVTFMLLVRVTLDDE